MLGDVESSIAPGPTLAEAFSRSPRLNGAHPLVIGVGRFTILDPEDVQPADLGSNFFVGPNHLGLPRAQVRHLERC